MHFKDLSDNSRIPVLVDMVTRVSESTEAAQVLDRMSEGMMKAYRTRGFMQLNVRGLPKGHYRVARRTDAEGNTQKLAPDPYQAEHLPIHDHGFFSDIIRTPEPKIVEGVNVSWDPVVGNALQGVTTMMATPAFENGELVVWVIIFGGPDLQFSCDDVESSLLRVNLVGMAFRAVRYGRELNEATRRIQSEVDRMAAIQKALLPSQMPEIPGLEIRASYETFDRVGGDLYDFGALQRLPDNKGYDPQGTWAIIIADASGHGPSAAVVVAMLHTLIHSYPTRPQGPAEILRHANEQFVEKAIESSFITAFLMFYEPSTRRVTYACAGHPPPLLKTAIGPSSVTSLEFEDGIPLGIMSEAIFSEHTFTLEPGQSLILYTDGVTEALSPSGEEFQTHGIVKALESCVGDAACVISSLRAALKRHEAGTRSRDDQAMVAVHARL
jgi:phosphoserine phosphatase RsbU/P